MRLLRTLLGRHPGQVEFCDPCASVRDARCRAGRPREQAILGAPTVGWRP